MEKKILKNWCKYMKPVHNTENFTDQLVYTKEILIQTQYNNFV